MAATQELWGSRLMNGSKIKALAEDREAFSRYVDQKFRVLDTERNGQLSKEELKPVALSIGSAMGLPPYGTSKESDHIYDEVLAEFLGGGKTDTVSKEQFAYVLRDMLLGVADGLERDPVMLITMDGKLLQDYVQGPGFEVEAMGVFSQAQGSGQRSAHDILVKALSKVPVQNGMPPVTNPQIMKDIVEPCLSLLGMDSDNKKHHLSQELFLDLFRKSLLDIATKLKVKPVTVAHVEKRFDGSSISTFLKNRFALRQILDDAWASIASTEGSDSILPKRDLRLALDLLASFAGLPPIGAVEEMDHVMDETFKLVDADGAGVLTKQEFEKCILEVLGGVMLQLQGKPISVSSSVLASDSGPEDCLKL